MEIKLLNLSCKNFMGFLDFNHAFDGKSTDVLGVNGSGKTTLKSLFNWVLFGKNADGDSDSNFSIRPLKKDGSMLRQVDIEGTILFDVDGKQVELKRVQRENWTKKRGSIELEFLGNNTEYYIDGVPKKKTEYDKFINDLVDSEVFKLITDVEYFGSLHWKKQRDIINNLLKIDERAILTSNSQFEKLVEYNKSVDEILLQIGAEQKKINKDLELIPAKISERAADISNKDRDENLALIDNLNGDLLLFNDKLERLNKAKYQAESSEMVKDEQKQLAKLQNDLTQAKANENKARLEFENAFYKEKATIEREKNSVSYNMSNLQNTITRLEYEINQAKENVERKKAELDALYAEHKKIKERPYIQGTCPLGKICTYEDVNADSLAAFNQKKAQDLEQNIFDGKRAKEKVNSLNAEIEEKQNKISDCYKEIDGNNKMLGELEAKLEQIGKKTYTPQFQEQITEIEEKISNTEEKIEYLQNSFDNSENDAKIESTKETIAKMNDQLYDAKKVEEAYVIIDGYNKELKQLQKKYEELEQIKILCNKYYVLRNSLIDDQNSKHFKLVKFKMFEEQINGGINETCVATVNGVPFKDLNHAMKINAGLDIINSLQTIYGVKAPIWIDNAEAITNFGEINSQCIKLYVAETESKKLEFIEKGDM